MWDSHLEKGGKCHRALWKPPAVPSLGSFKTKLGLLLLLKQRRPCQGHFRPKGTVILFAFLIYCNLVGLCPTPNNLLLLLVLLFLFFIFLLFFLMNSISRSPDYNELHIGLRLNLNAF